MCIRVAMACQAAKPWRICQPVRLPARQHHRAGSVPGPSTRKPLLSRRRDQRLDRACEASAELMESGRLAPTQVNGARFLASATASSLQRKAGRIPRIQRGSAKASIPRRRFRLVFTWARVLGAARDPCSRARGTGKLAIHQVFREHHMGRTTSPESPGPPPGGGLFPTRALSGLPMK
jgi:hypothetical protein